ncbi:MAG: sulfite exporter TauE/SafE family protein [Alphaproteobacteria bacterium]|nr:MAG: sulfite exporter TauE/SafE family protein [Alphaproteobacteria bacterium]
MEEMLAEPAMWALAVGALIAGLLRGFAGFGAGMVFIPIAAAAFDPRIAAGTLFVIDTILIVPLVVRAAGHVAWREIVPLGLGAVIAVPAGVAVLVHVDPLPIRWGLSAAILTAIVVLACGWRYRGPERLPLSIAIGGVAGFFSGLEQLPGPPVLVYWLGRNTPAQKLRANAIIFFCFTTVAAGIAYAASGLFTAEVAARSAMLLPVYAIAIFAGSQLFGRASEATYRRIAYGLITFVALATLPVFDNLIK